MNILLLKGYNNYFNRILKTETSLDNYKSASTSYLEYADVNFVYNDGVATELVVGGPTQTDSGSLLSWDDNGAPDYLIAWESVNNVPTIRSRWFVMESVKTRKGQYRIALKRDVLADEKETVMNSPCYVEKGTIKDAYSPLLFNSEGNTYNQIKINETQIKDETGCAWLVGYLKKNITATDLQNINPIVFTPADAERVIYEEDDLYFSAGIKYINSAGIVENPDVKNYAHRYSYLGEPTATLAANFLHTRRPQTDEYHVVGMQLNSDGGQWAEPTVAISTQILGGSYPKYSALKLQTFPNSVVGAERTTSDSNAIGAAKAFLDKSNGSASWQALLATITNEVATEKNLTFGSSNIQGQWGELRYQGAYVRHNNKVYRLALTKKTGSVKKNVKFETIRSWLTINSNGATYYDPAADTETSVSPQTWADSHVDLFKLNFNWEELEAVAIETTVDNTISFTFPASSARRPTEDALYDIFCLPVDPSVFGLNGSANTILDLGNDATLNVSAVSKSELDFIIYTMTKLGAGTSAGFAYDLQLLPYCPLQLPCTNVDNYISIDLTGLTADFDYSLIKTTNNANKGIIFWADNANFSKDISFEKSFLHPVSYREIVQEATYRFNAVYDGEEIIYITNVSSPIYLDEALPAGATITKLIVDVNHFADERILGYDLDGDELILNLDPDWLPQGDSSVDLDISVELYYELLEDISAVDKKVMNETDFVRLTSPNFNSMFEFKLTKLNDGLHYINVDCTYKPYSPYIKLNPDFSFLYGQDFNDSTGLILQGDFSLPLINDPFVNYELNNRNYQAIFNRQIQNLDVNNKIAMEQQIFTATVGSLTGGLTGAATGIRAGGGAAGAAVGAAVGLGLGAAGGIADNLWLRRSQEEARDFAIDNYNMKLGNVKALPESMTKATPLSYNNKVWPIFEEFSCTGLEKDLLNNKLHYDGMTVMAIGSLTDYAVSGGWVKGRLIRQYNMEDDFHVADELYKEVNKGFYLGD